MSNLWTSYQTKSTLLDVTVPKIGAGQQVKSPNGGTYSPNSATTIEVSPNSIGSTAVANGQVIDALYLEIIPPVDSTGTYPDVEISFIVDGKDMSDYQVIDGSYNGNMFPRRQQTAGRRFVRLGYSTRDLLRKIAKGQNVSGFPLKITGFKASSSINIQVKSAAGWGQSAAATTDLRVIVKGDVLEESDIAQYNSIIQNPGIMSMVLDKAPALPFTLPFFSINGPLSRKTWTALPGGKNQSGGLKINRKLAYAYNNQATATNGLYVFSQKQSLLGQEGNVVDAQHDLGFDFSDNNDAFLLQELGLRFATTADTAEGFFGMRIDGNVIPQDTPNGTPVSYAINDYQYGQAAPQLTGANMYYAMPEATELGNFMLHKNAGAPFFSTAGTTAIAAGDISIALGGVLIEQN